MINRFKKYLDKLFIFCAKTRRMLDFKEELLGVLMDKYEELRADGFGEEETYRVCIEGLDGYKDAIKELEQDKSNDITRAQAAMAVYATLAFLMATLIIYFSVSFATGKWSVTWVVFILALVIYLITVFVGIYVMSRKQSKYFVTRASIQGLTITTGTLIYLSISFLTDMWQYTWISYICVVLICYLSDIIFRIKYKVKMFTFYDSFILVLLTTLFVYFTASFVTGMWAYTWLTFICGAFVEFLFLFAYKYALYRKSIKEPDRTAAEARSESEDEGSAA